MRSNVSVTNFCLLVIIILVFSVTPCLSSVTGTVNDTSGSPVSSALVTFTDETNAENEFSAYSDDEGKYSITFTPVSVKEGTPANFQLQQNYPNPFNPTTTIPFSLDEAGYVNLSIYNITGQKVRTPVDNYHSVGSHTVTWNGLDDSGKSVAAGIYIYQLRFGDTVESRKMLLIDGGSSFNSSNQIVARATVMAKTVSDAENTTYLVTITGDDIESYEESGVTIVDGETYDFVVVRPFEIHDITFVTITGGSFRMGDISGDGGSKERPVHTVSITGFEMSTCEIIQEQYEDIIGSNPSDFSGTKLPVEYVTWYDAVKYCNELSDAAGLTHCYNESTWACDFTANGFRLPTEAEWEFACRAGTETKYYTGSSDSDLGRGGWYFNNWGDANRKTHQAGEKEANAWGLYDMHGNVWEWCNDWHSIGYYDSSPSADPVGPTSGSSRVKRGGGWNSKASDCRSANRFGNPPSIRSNILGFRVVRKSGQ